MFNAVFASNRPRLHRQRPSMQPLLPVLTDSLASPGRGRPARWSRMLVGVVGTYWLWTLLHSVPQEVARSVTLALRGESCEAEGLVSPSSPNRGDQHRVVVRIRPTVQGEPRTRNPDNTVLASPFHPSLSAQHHALFNNVTAPLPLGSTHPKQCITPATQFLPLLPCSSASDAAHANSLEVKRMPEVFFSVCTTPQRAVKYSAVWHHFMSAPAVDMTARQNDDRSAPSRSPGCLVTDAQGQGDSKGMASANAEFRRRGLSCTMRDSSRAGQRYEMRVLGLIHDAWVESERRRWQDGAPIVEWFVFGDDDTWFSDSQMLRDMLAAYDPREDWFLGSFSETLGNFRAFGKIGFGGAGIILSRSLVHRMQPYVNECAQRFGHIFGGDGLISHCAAWVRDIPLDQLVEEIPALRQMDIRGDASGYLTAGTAPFLTLHAPFSSQPHPLILTLHHWAGWLDLIPGIDGLDAITLMSEAVSAIGGRNFLRRWIFDGGLVIFTAGYSITVHREALEPGDLARIEWTWEHHEPRRPSRRGLREYDDKLTYYLTSVERLSPKVALLRHTCSHPSVQAGLREIDVLWDVRTEQASWRDRWLPGWAGARPSPRAGTAKAHRSAKGHVRRAEEGDEAMVREELGEVKAPEEDSEGRAVGQTKKREVQFSG